MKRAVVFVALIIAVCWGFGTAKPLRPVRILPGVIKPEIVPKGTIRPIMSEPAPKHMPADFEANGPPTGLNLPPTHMPADFEANGPPSGVNLPPTHMPADFEANGPPSGLNLPPTHMPDDFEANGPPSGVNLPATHMPADFEANGPPSGLNLPPTHMPADFEANGPPSGLNLPPTHMPADFERNGPPSGVVIPGVAPSTPAVVNLPQKPDVKVPQTMRPISEMTPTGPVIRGFTPSAVNAPASETSTINLPTQGPPTKAGKNPLVYEVTYVTADGLPAVVDADVKTTERQISSKELNKAWGAIPSAVVESPAARNAASNIVAGIVAPAATRVLKLGAKAGDNPCVRGGGQCQDQGTCAGKVTKLLCPGPPSIVCCTYATSACTAAKGSCKSRDSCPSDKQHKVPGMCGADADTVCCMTDGGAIKNVAGNCLANFNPTVFATRAKKYLSEYKAQSSADAVAEAAMKAFGLEPRVTRTDPASLVITALESLGWGCHFNAATGKTVKAMIPVMTAHGGLQPYPKMGDVVMWEESTGVVASVCVGGKLDVVLMSPSTQTSVIESTGCITLKELQIRDKSKFLGFWTPQ